MDESESVCELAKKINLQDAVSWMKSAWNQVNSDTIVKCFNHSGFIAVCPEAVLEPHKTENDIRGFSVIAGIEYDEGALQEDNNLECYDELEENWEERLLHNYSTAPRNCLQYYTGPSGSLSSFNFIPDQPSVQSGGYLNNVNYAVCFRKELGYCTQTYTVRPSNAGTDFAILNLDEQNNAPTVGSGQAGLGVVECPHDYVRLAGDRYCGTRLNPSTSPTNPTVNAPVTDNTTGPFVAQFVSNSEYNAVGISLDYNQNRCENQARRYYK